MKTQTIIQDYYGATRFIEENKDKELTIFIVDDDKIYLSLLRNSLKRDNFSIYDFTSGEECIEYLDLKPDLAILDYHLDGTNPYAMRGDKISEIISQKSPHTEVIIISSDSKFKFISDINFSKKIFFKDGNLIHKLENRTNNIINKIKENGSLTGRTAKTIIFTATVIIISYLLLNYFSF
jgi:CheY-like chemotaxis protein